MSNPNSQTLRPGHFTETTRLHSNLGWLDYMLGRGFPPGYDTWHEVEQCNYEYGRLRAAAAPFHFPRGRVPNRQTTQAVRRIALGANGYLPHWREQQEAQARAHTRAKALAILQNASTTNDLTAFGL